MFPDVSVFAQIEYIEVPVRSRQIAPEKAAGKSAVVWKGIGRI
jgi:hypothetical protein